MVQAVRDGEPLRGVARRFGVSPGNVSFWVERCKGKRLDRCDFEDRASGPHRPWNRTALSQERRVLSMRKQLETSVLGESGAPAIHQALQEAGGRLVPAVATIGRILKRHGRTDARKRVRRPAPPRGWHLPQVAAGEAKLDIFDLIEDLKLDKGPQFSVLTATSVHANQADAWPQLGIGSREVVNCLTARWRAIGLPHYAQFDNDTRFQGAHQFADTVGRVSRLCLALGITPVFAPPLEHGFQNPIEGFNALWQSKVWQRFYFADLAALQSHSRLYVQAHQQRTVKRREAAPQRRAFPKGWHFDLGRVLSGTLIYLRRTDAKGNVQLLGHRFAVDRLWLHRLVRCEVHFDLQCIRCYALRRRDPGDQPLLAETAYQHPNKPFKGTT
jgi:hypothetical protein